MFARLKYASGEHRSISFIRELADHARNLVADSQRQHPDAVPGQSVTTDLDQLFNLDTSTSISVDEVSDATYLSPWLLEVIIPREFLLTDSCMVDFHVQQSMNMDIVDFGYYEWPLMPNIVV